MFFWYYKFYITATQPRGPCFNLVDAKTGMFQDDFVNTMAADALVTCVARSSAAMVLNMEDKWVLVLYEEGFQLIVPPQYWKMTANTNTFSYLKEW